MIFFKCHVSERLLKIALSFSVLILFLSVSQSFAQDDKNSYTLSEAISYALMNNPGVTVSRKDVEIENYNIREAKGNRYPKIDIRGGAVRSYYAMPVTPISGPPTEGGFPEFDETIYDMGFAFSLPLYRGGRLEREVEIAELSKLLKIDTLELTKQELIYNITSVYYKALQLSRIREANEATVKQLDEHKHNVKLLLDSGAVPRVELLRAETELAHAKQNLLVVRHRLKSTYELLKVLMGIGDDRKEISVMPEIFNQTYPDYRQSLEVALSLRPDYRAAQGKVKIAEQRVKLARGRRLPSISLTGEYLENAGTNLDFEEEWNVAIRFSIPLFDGGVIRAQVNRQAKELEKAKEEERSLRLEIVREIKDAFLSIESALERIKVTEKAVDAARENVRIETLRFETGEGTSTDLLDAQAALLRAEMDYYQVLYDLDISIFSLRKAVGENMFREGSL